MEFLLQRSKVVGARTLVHAISDGPGSRETHGRYLSDCQVSASPLNTDKWGNEKELRKRIWAELLMKLETIEPGISRII